MLFRPIHCTDVNHADSSSDLLCGIIKSVSPHFRINVTQEVNCTHVLTVHVVGRCCLTQRYPDNIKEIRKGGDSEVLPLPLKHFRREVTSKRIQEAGDTVDSAEIICSQIKCVDDIIVGSRHLIVSDSIFTRTQVGVWESCILRPSTFNAKFNWMLDLLETTNNEMLNYIKKTRLRSWAEKAKNLSCFRMKIASIRVQAFFRGYHVRKILSKMPNRFKSYYVPKHLIGTVRCYEIKPGIYLSTQAKANEYFVLLSKSISIISKLSIFSARGRMITSLSRWKRAISEQKMEQLRMSEEEIFSIF